MPRTGNRPLHPGHPMQGLELVGRTGLFSGRMGEGTAVVTIAASTRWRSGSGRSNPASTSSGRRYDNGRTWNEASLPVSDWITQLVIPAANTATGAPRYMASSARLLRLGRRVRVFMRRPGASTSPADQDAVIEAARLALAQGRNILASGQGTNLQKLLLQDYDDPIAAIIGRPPAVDGHRRGYRI